MDEEHQFLRERIAEHHGFQLYEKYGEEQAASFIGVNLSWMKEHREKRLIPFTRLSERKVRYYGYQIADIMIKGSGEWADTTSGSLQSAPTGSDSEKAPQPITDAGGKVDAQSALHLARRTLKPPSKP